MDAADAMRLIIARSPGHTAEAMKTLRALRVNPPVARPRAERVIGYALGDPESTFSGDERVALVDFLSGVERAPRYLDVRLRVNAYEKEQIHEMADADGLNVSDFIRLRLGLSSLG